MYLVVFLLLLTICDVLPSQAGSTSSHISSFWLYNGNEFEQAHRLFNLTTEFNATEYFIDYNNCKNGKCQMWVNDWHRKTARLWKSSYNETSFDERLSVDCSYNIQLDHVEVSTSSLPVSSTSLTSSVSQSLLVTKYEFILTQSDCVVGDSLSFRGGSSFDITAQTPRSAVGCTAFDRFDGQYIISCRVPTLHMRSLPSGKSQSHEGLSATTNGHHNPNGHPSHIPHNSHGNDEYSPTTPECISITVLLNYEHFDAYSEVITDIFSLFKYYPLQRVLVDNITFCPSEHDIRKQPDTSIHIRSESTSSSTSSSSSSSSSSSLFSKDISQLLAHADWYTGVWLSDTQSSHTATPSSENSQSFQTHSNSNSDSFSDSHSDTSLDSDLTDFMAAWPYAKYVRKEGNFSSSFLQENRHFVPLISSSDPSSSRVNEYQFVPLVSSSLLSSSSSSSSSSSQSYHSSNTAHESDEISMHTCRYTFQSFSSMWSQIKDSHEYYFIGASHMRYFFDSTALRAFGVHTVDAKERKHGTLTVENLNFEWVITAAEQAVFLPTLCQKFELLAKEEKVNHRPVTNRTIVFQTGAHDLAERGVRSLMYNPLYGPSLMKAIRSILEGHTPCGALTHFVYITLAPFPELYLHYADEPSERLWRGYRNNPAIAAGSEYYLRQFNSIDLLKSNTNGIRLSIVDMYSITMPRMLFSEQNEQLCICHFLCMVQEGTEKYMTYTPGGLAVLRSIWAALYRSLGIGV